MLMAVVLLYHNGPIFAQINAPPHSRERRKLRFAFE
ncbi:hypothetical protein TcasGA2_TC033121 [Tribolium castaneum]|uniref:Uncharacterized protein n=1 Tax=Tribolium castaneum TaxID=7070 RepID=A0A139WGT6_TRICA|nr:hypothetical protein TcasGA2_TC033121 [Tribolium castaneum]